MDLKRVIARGVYPAKAAVGLLLAGTALYAAALLWIPHGGYEFFGKIGLAQYFDMTLGGRIASWVRRDLRLDAARLLGVLAAVVLTFAFRRTPLLSDLRVFARAFRAGALHLLRHVLAAVLVLFGGLNRPPTFLRGWLNHKDAETARRLGVGGLAHVPAWLADALIQRAVSIYDGAHVGPTGPPPVVELRDAIKAGDNGLRGLMVALTSFCAFAIASLASVDDYAFFSTKGTFKLPILGIDVAPQALFVVVPVITLGLLVYVHVDLGVLMGLRLGLRIREGAYEGKSAQADAAAARLNAGILAAAEQPTSLGALARLTVVGVLWVFPVIVLWLYWARLLRFRGDTFLALSAGQMPSLLLTGIFAFAGILTAVVWTSLRHAVQRTLDYALAPANAREESGRPTPRFSAGYKIARRFCIVMALILAVPVGVITLTGGLPSPFDCGGDCETKLSPESLSGRRFACAAFAITRGDNPFFSVRLGQRELSKPKETDSAIGIIPIRLNGVQLDCADMHGAYLAEAKGDSATSLRGANLESADLTNAVLRGARIRGAILNVRQLKDAGFDVDALAADAATETMVTIPGGPVFMGCNAEIDKDCSEDEVPGRTVYVSTFKIDRTEVSVEAYRRCVAFARCDDNGLETTFIGGKERTGWNHQCNWRDGSNRKQHPINCVNWEQAKTYCQVLGKRLPTEAEWEAAARGSGRRKYPWGDEDPTCDRAIMKGCTIRENPGTLPVGGRPLGATPQGVQDMAGNVSEWVSDWYGELPAGGSHDPQRQEATKPFRVRRGGQWTSLQSYGRVSSRSAAEPTERAGYVGFRCAQ
jgi:formylglycine-generating enzyme required for sulfatase activity